MQKYVLYLRPCFQNRCNTSTLVVGRRRTNYHIKYPCLKPRLFLYSARKETPKKTLLAGSEKGKSTQCGEMPFLELELGFYSSCCELFSNPRAGSVIPYLFLFSYTTSTRPPKAQSRRLQVGKLKTSRSF